MSDEQNTTLKQDLSRLWNAILALRNPLAQSVYDSSRNNLRWFGHSAMNVIVEAVRRNSSGWIQANAPNVARGIVILVVGLGLWWVFG